MRTLAAIIALCVLTTVCGCDSAGRSAQPAQTRQSTEEKTRLQNQLEQARRENELLKKQIEVLSNLPGDVRAENLYHLKAIRIGRYTNFYDNDKDGKKETLTVYIHPIDEVGDAIKAAGAFDVQLWDLSSPPKEAMLGQWRIEPESVKKMWFATLLANNYRLTFDASKIIDQLGPGATALTVKVTFTDYLSGRVFTDQRVIKP
jgi:hypothetical protein